MMFAQPRLIAAGAVVSLLGCGLLAGCGQQAGQQTASGAAAQHTRPAGQHTRPAGSAARAQPAAIRFSRPLDVSNKMFPLIVGTQFTYEGTIVEGGESRSHGVVFTVTDLVKTVDHVRTVVALDQDYLEGTLQEQELAFFAQDDKGNVWNFGEYPEEYDNGKFTGAPSTWIRETAGAYGGIHMLDRPRVSAQYREGLVPSIQFDDVSRVTRTGQANCVKTECYHQVLVVDETSPNDPASGHQIKYYAPGTGLIRVSARGGDSQEFLVLATVRHLGAPAMAKMRAEALAMDQRAYRVAKVYRTTTEAARR